MRKGIRAFLNNLIKFIRRHLSGDHPDFPFYLLIFSAFVLFIVGTNVFVELTAEIPGMGLERFDNRVTDFFIENRSAALTDFFQIITDLGDVYGYVFFTALATFFFFFKLRNKKFILQLLGVVILSALSNMALKRVINRARPTIDHLVVVKTLSYPSGHAMSAMAFYGFLTYLVFKIKMSRWLRAFLVAVFLFMILGIGLSRIYLGVHFPSDVAGGYIAGLIWVAFCIILFNIIELLREKKRRRNRFSEPEEENLEV